MAEGLTMKFEIFGEKQVDRMLSYPIGQVKDLRPVWWRMRDNFSAGQKKHFKSEGSATGAKFQALSAKYAAWKRKHYPGKPILQRTGALYRSLTNVRAKGAIYRALPMSLIIGTKISYAAYHQFGGGALPRRPVVRLTEKQKKLFMKFLQEHLFKELGGFGPRLII